MHYKIILGALAVIVGVIGFVPYYLDIFKGKTKPHTFSWLGWTIMESIGFFAQISQHAGPGAWVTGTNMFLTLGIVVLSFRYGEKNIKILDWIAFTTGLIGIVLWQITKNPLSAVVLITLADALMFVPTFRKAFHKPQEETLFEYLSSCVKWILGIGALQTYSPVTWLYPGSLILSNGIFVSMLLWRRKIHPK